MGQTKELVETEVLIIGAGITGMGLARDLALRGVRSVIVDSRDINAGASGANHGLLHSGARYVSVDPTTAMECAQEANLLKALAPQSIEKTGGIFVAVQGDEEKFIGDFPLCCSQCRISAEELDPYEAREMEPSLSERLIAAYRVQDATVDPFRLSLDNLSEAQSLGALFFPRRKVLGFRKKGKRILAAHLVHTQTGKEAEVEVRFVVNAAGAWAGEVASMAGASMHVVFSKGTLLVTHRRLATCVINRLRPPGDGDILVPGGTVSILGTTSVRIPSLEEIRPSVKEVDLIVEEGSAMVPSLADARYIRAYAGVRPLVGPQCEGDDRSMGRGFSLVDHECEGIENLATISGGKLTTYRLMAERTADLVCARIGVSRPCLTYTRPLGSSVENQWTQPGLGPRLWAKGDPFRDPLLCECEMLPRSAIQGLIRSLSNQRIQPDLEGMRMRSRLGKGPCQGTFCGVRVTGHLYSQGNFQAKEGVEHLQRFLQERWTGERPVLWGAQLMQAELKQALFLGLSGIDL